MRREGGDSITLNSSVNSLSTSIVEELDSAKYLLGLDKMAAEDLMEVMGFFLCFHFLTFLFKILQYNHYRFSERTQ